MSNVPTVSDTKRAFYNHHTRPIASVYRRVIEELLVEMHLLRVNEDFAYDAIYALGIVTTFDRFMEGYRPEADKDAIFQALCQAADSSAEQYRQDAQRLLESSAGLDLEGLKALMAAPADQGDALQETFNMLRERDRFKYSRAFGVGLYSLLETVDADLAKDKTALTAFIQTAADALPLSFEKLQKDLELYRSNLDKMTQAQIMMADILAADRKKREERAQAKSEAADAAQETAAETPKEDAEPSETGDA
ncbi:MAG: photosystem II biogenesis protein Psp29 [Leptolyngbya sp. RL_3_1]|nr:photosystem II biogenesis protein Psp29 [Leptolyngbya sp. RL_3_1]